MNKQLSTVLLCLRMRILATNRKLPKIPSVGAFYCSGQASWRLDVTVHSINTSLGGLEPPSSRLTAERASLLRHRDLLLQWLFYFLSVWYSPIWKLFFFLLLFIGKKQTIVQVPLSRVQVESKSFGPNLKQVPSRVTRLCRLCRVESSRVTRLCRLCRVKSSRVTRLCRVKSSRVTRLCQGYALFVRNISVACLACSFFFSVCWVVIISKLNYFGNTNTRSSHDDSVAVWVHSCGSALA